MSRWIKLHYNDNGDAVLVNMDNVVNVSNRHKDPLHGEVIADHTVLTTKVSQMHVRETVEVIAKMIGGKYEELIGNSADYYICDESINASRGEDDISIHNKDGEHEGAAEEECSDD